MLCAGNDRCRATISHLNRVRCGWKGSKVHCSWTVGREAVVPSPSSGTEMMAVPLPASVSNASSIKFWDTAGYNEQATIPLDSHSSHLLQSHCRLSWLKAWGYTANLSQLWCMALHRGTWISYLRLLVLQVASGAALAADKLRDFGVHTLV